MNISVEYQWFCLLEILPGGSHAGNTKETVLVMVDSMLSYTYVVCQKEDALQLNLPIPARVLSRLIKITMTMLLLAYVSFT